MNKINALITIVVEKGVQISTIILVANYANQEILGFTAALIAIAQRAAGIGSMDIGRTWLVSKNPVLKIFSNPILYIFGYVLGIALTIIFLWNWLTSTEYNNIYISLYCILIYNALYFQQTIVPLEFYKKGSRYQINNSYKNIISACLRMFLILKFPTTMLVYFSGLLAQLIFTIDRSNFYHYKLLSIKKNKDLFKIFKNSEFKNIIYTNLNQILPIIYIYHLIKISETTDIYYLLMPLTLVGMVMTIIRPLMRVHLLSDIKGNEYRIALNIVISLIIFSLILVVLGQNEVIKLIIKNVFPVASNKVTEDCSLALSIQLISIVANLLIIEIARLVVNVNKILKFEMGLFLLLGLSVLGIQEVNNFIWSYAFLYVLGSVVVLIELKNYAKN